jgi:undecaprenyl-diphosphatase
VTAGPPRSRSARLRALAAAAVDFARSYIERRTLIVVMLISGLGWGFAQLADEAIEGETHAFDTAVLLALRSPADPADPLGPGWVEELGRDVTALGGVGVLVGLTIAVAGFLWLGGKRREMWFVLAAVASGQLASSLFKLGFDRPRPDLVPHGAITYSSKDVPGAFRKS